MGYWETRCSKPPEIPRLVESFREVRDGNFRRLKVKRKP